MQIEPQYTLPLVYQLADPSDTGTYYVRAVLRNSLTGATLETKNLVQGSGGRFTSSLLTPKDPTGQGLYVDVTITVYTDSGYSTVSDAYRRETTNYVIKRATPIFGGGGGADVDYDKIEKMIVKHIKANKTEDKQQDNSDILLAIKQVGKLVQSIEIPEQEKLDLSPVLESIGGQEKRLTDHISAKVDNIEFPEQEETDLSPVLELLQQVLSGHTKLSDLSHDHKEELKTFLTGVREDLSKQDEERNKRTWEGVRKIFAGYPEGESPLSTPAPKEEAKPSPFMEFMKKP